MAEKSLEFMVSAALDPVNNRKSDQIMNSSRYFRDFTGSMIAAYKEQALMGLKGASGKNVEEVLNHRTLSCSKAKPYWKPNRDFLLKREGKRKSTIVIVSW